MNSEAVSALIAKTPSLKAAKARLEAMEPGAYVVHRSWGFGQIKSYDETAQRLLIDFKGKKSHAMDPAFCLGTTSPWTWAAAMVCFCPCFRRCTIA